MVERPIHKPGNGNQRRPADGTAEKYFISEAPSWTTSERPVTTKSDQT